MRACILVRVTPGSESGVAESLGSVEAIEDAFPVLGQPEVVARVRVPSIENLGGVVSRISETEGVVVSETLVEIPGEAIS